MALIASCKESCVCQVTGFRQHDHNVPVTNLLGWLGWWKNNNCRAGSFMQLSPLYFYVYCYGPNVKTLMSIKCLLLTF